MIKNKKGISAIVATVLIILITVAAVTIIWAAIIPMITEGMNKGTACLDASQQVTISNVCQNTTHLKFKLSAGSGDFNLADLQLIMGLGDSSQSINMIAGANIAKSVLPGKNEYRQISITETNLDLDGTSGSSLADIKEFSYAPIIAIGNSEEICDATVPVSVGEC